MNEYVKWQTIAWFVLSLWVLGNIVLLGLPLPDMYRIVPSLLLNGVLGATTIIVWSRYNKVRELVRSAKVKAQMLVDEQAEQQIAKVGHTQTLTVSQSLFDVISQGGGQWVQIDVVYKDVFKKGKRLRVHNEADYGTMKHIEVTDVRIADDGEFSAQLKYLN